LVVQGSSQIRCQSRSCELEWCDGDRLEAEYASNMGRIVE
jgi:hypothetical protein